MRYCLRLAGRTNIPCSKGIGAERVAHRQVAAGRGAGSRAYPPSPLMDVKKCRTWHAILLTRVATGAVVLNLKNRPDWLDMQRQFHDYIAAHEAGAVDPACRDRLFSSIYQAVEYLSIAHYRQYAGYGTKQTEYALDGVQNRVWKIEYADSAGPNDGAQQEYADRPDQPGQRCSKKKRTFTSLVTEEYRAQAPIGNFLSLVVANALRDWFREQNRHQKLNLQLSATLYREIVEIGCADVPATSLHLAWGMGSHPRSPEEQIEISELQRSMAMLSQKEQQLLDLYYFQGLSAAEIASLTGANQSTLRTQISRATQAVRDVMSSL